jgi:hypothetical protein
MLPINFFQKKGLSYVKGYRSALDRMLAFDIAWASYDDHKVTRPFEEISYYFGWTRSGLMTVMYPPERVLR